MDVDKLLEGNNPEKDSSPEEQKKQPNAGWLNYTSTNEPNFKKEYHLD